VGPELGERALGVGAPAAIVRALGPRRQGVVERAAHRAVIALTGPPGRRLPPRLAARLTDRAAGWSHMWGSLFPPGNYLAARDPAPASTSRRRARHLATMTPPVLHAFARRLRLERRRTANGLGSGQALAAVPGDKPAPEPFEAISWRRCLEVFPTTPIAIVAPEGLDLGAYLPAERAASRLVHVVRFDPGFFRTAEAYSRLLLTADFYRAFASYEFMLVYQLDVFVFRDELAAWCARGWDFVGAPWIGCEWLAELKVQWPAATRDNVVGDGGFSLRRGAGGPEVPAQKARGALWLGGEGKHVLGPPPPGPAPPSGSPPPA